MQRTLICLETIGKIQMKKLTDFISFFLFRLVFGLFWLIPFRIIYLFSDLMYYKIYYLIRYRRKVVRDNLCRSFPDKSKKEIISIEKKYYRHFCDILVESFKAFGMTRQQFIKRYRILNPELMEAYYKKGQSVIVVLGHYNNWEWGSVASAQQMKHIPVGIYKPLSNIYFDHYIRKKREKSGTILAPLIHTGEYFERYRSKICAFMLIADQSPSTIRLAIWGKFLNQDTAFIHGPEKYSKLFNYPLIYAAIEKVKRGYYTIEFRSISDEPSKEKPHVLTHAYMQLLEQQIVRHPEYWLWSHRRWKHKKPQA
ncbi:MAG: lysophospholipid acyltransferase family protein [Bacteroidota bacterium]|nr:lysophospholipid acyltransferase family protein [Bacteroidota bacterium]